MRRAEKPKLEDLSFTDMRERVLNAPVGEKMKRLSEIKKHTTESLKREMGK